MYLGYVLTCLFTCSLWYECIDTTIKRRIELHTSHYISNDVIFDNSPLHWIELFDMVWYGLICFDMVWYGMHGRCCQQKWHKIFFYQVAFVGRFWGVECQQVDGIYAEVNPILPWKNNTRWIHLSRLLSTFPKQQEKIWSPRFRGKPGLQQLLRYFAAFRGRFRTL